MRINKTTEYGLRTMIYLACQDKITTAERICSACEIPQNYFQKVSASLKAADLVTIYRGKQGGFLIARPPAEITIYDVVDAMGEIETYENDCRLYGGDCIRDERENRCPLKKALTNLEQAERDALQKLTLEDVIQPEVGCCAAADVRDRQ